MQELIDVDRDGPMGRIQGKVASGFEAVTGAFEQNFLERGEVGAAFCAFHQGRPVVDLNGGVADPADKSPWEPSTIVPVFSGTKGFVAFCLLLLIEREMLELDAPVCRYWPDFAHNGKQKIRVSDVVSHRAALPGIREPLAREDILDEDLMVGLIESATPFWEPDGRVCYHPLTFGWICGELIRRIDGRRVGRFFADEVAAQLSLDIWIGLPAHAETRVATLVPGAGWGTGPRHPLVGTDPDVAAVYNNPPGVGEPPLQHNTSAFHAAGVPATGAIGSARSIARLYACLAGDGEIDGIHLISPDVVALARRPLSRGADVLIDTPQAFGVGFELQTEVRLLGSPQSAFGHTGVGGSCHGAWPDHAVGFSYAMNDLRGDGPDPRAQALLRALLQAIDQPS